ncbi:hypothetical protein F4808DRAFT_461748 [Astrocystis sublimbata]|nr:hypothetical protein F4808DRAFT_461748 [Astrocystis sublimbata]
MPRPELVIQMGLTGICTRLVFEIRLVAAGSLAVDWRPTSTGAIAAGHVPKGNVLGLEDAN